MPDRNTFRFRGAGLAFTAALALLPAACARSDFPILSAAGPVAMTERDLIFRAVAIMMIVVVPVFVLTAWFAWNYRASKKNLNYDREWMSWKVDAAVWIVPALIVVALAAHVWTYTHSLDPYRPIDPATKPLEVEVVAQDWKWLFIYPEEGVASVNELAFPAGRPLRLTLTSDTVMNAFFIPALGSQIYAMAGMTTQLNLRADEPGDFVGRNTQFSGDGFANQRFAAKAMTAADFDAWVTGARAAPEALDDATYAKLAKPSESHPVTYYSSVAPGLFAGIVAKYHGGMPAHAAVATPVAGATAGEQAH